MLVREAKVILVCWLDQSEAAAPSQVEPIVRRFSAVVTEMVIYIQPMAFSLLLAWYQ